MLVRSWQELDLKCGLKCVPRSETRDKVLKIVGPHYCIDDNKRCTWGNVKGSGMDSHKETMHQKREIEVKKACEICSMRYDGAGVVPYP